MLQKHALKCCPCRQHTRDNDPCVCSDIDECSEGLVQCDTHATCVNLPGWYHCECREGYHDNEVFTANGESCKGMVVQTHTHSSQAMSMFTHSLTSSPSRHRRVSDGPQHLRQRHRVFQPGRRIRLPLSARAQLHRRLHPRQQGQAQRTDLGPGQ